MGRNYANPPVIEAVCEFRLTSDPAWDMTIPGLIYEKIGKVFPLKEQRSIREIEFNQGPEGLKQQVRINQCMVFLTGDRKSFVQIGPNLLAVNCLKPYPAWEKFKPHIENTFNTLAEVIEVKGLERIGLRYVNRVEVPGPPVDLDDYFQFRPFLGKDLPQDMTSFMVGCILPFCDQRDLCKVELTSALPETPQSSAFVLDLDYFLTQPGAVAPGQALTWVESAHDQVERVFEGCISDALRKIFKET